MPTRGQSGKSEDAILPIINTPRPVAKRTVPLVEKNNEEAYMKPFLERCYPAATGMMIPNDSIKEPDHPWSISYNLQGGNIPHSLLAPPGEQQTAHDRLVAVYLRKRHKNVRACYTWLEYEHYFNETAKQAGERRWNLMKINTTAIQIHEWCRENRLTKTPGCGKDAPLLTVQVARKGVPDSEQAFSENVQYPLRQPPGANKVLKKPSTEPKDPVECSIDGYLQFVDVKLVEFKKLVPDDPVTKAVLNELTSGWKTLDYGNREANAKTIQGLPGAAALLSSGSPLCGGKDTIDMEFFDSGLRPQNVGGFAEEISAQCTHYLWSPENGLVVFALYVDSYEKAKKWKLPWLGPMGRDAEAGEDGNNYFYLTLVCALNGVERISPKVASAGKLGIVSLMLYALKSYNCSRIVLSSMPNVFFYYTKLFNARPIRSDTGKHGGTGEQDGFTFNHPGDTPGSLYNFPELPDAWKELANKISKPVGRESEGLPVYNDHPLAPISFKEYTYETRKMLELELTARYYRLLDEIYQISVAIDSGNATEADKRAMLKSKAVAIAEEIIELKQDGPSGRSALSLN